MGDPHREHGAGAHLDDLPAAAEGLNADATLLSVDLGNTACKLRLWSVGPDRSGTPRLAARGDVPTGPGLARELAAWLARQPAPQRTVLASVAALELEQSAAEVLARATAGAFERTPDSGLAIECREPARVGRDRLFAARGACAVAGASCVVLDAGTALTVDAVRVVRGARPAFLGGAIAPGPALLARALAEGTARLPLVEPDPRAAALGRDTESAVRAGVSVGFRGAARELALRVAREAGLDDAPLIVTGGARAFLLGEPLLAGRTVLEVEDLVHVGLVAAALDLDAWVSA